VSRPLDGLLVLDFSQFMAGPGATLRLADLGARVIKIERPGAGDSARQLYCSRLHFDGASTLFHTVNRNKQSFAIDLKDPNGVARIRKLIQRADVMVENFRPGVMKRLGLDFDTAAALNPKLIYASVTGYGQEGPWRDRPGQDLLVQSRSGLVWLSGNESDPPIPFGLAVADMFAAQHVVQGILACLVRRGINGRGGHVEVSLLESVLDLQFEVITTHLNDGGQLPARGRANSAHAYLAAPYGLYKTMDGYLAIAMNPVPRLGELLDLPELKKYTDSDSWFEHRDSIREVLAKRLQTQSTRAWLDVLEPADIWCAEVLNWRELVANCAFTCLKVTQPISRDGGAKLLTTRCPIRIDGEILTSPTPAPRVGEHGDVIAREFGLS
jgi:crotonobetainyl-CoA:carnitine CoA-transferase CaiB-like acyl-CoA transferase